MNIYIYIKINWFLKNNTLIDKNKKYIIKITLIQYTYFVANYINNLFYINLNMVHNLK